MSKETDFQEFERTGYYKDLEYAGQFQACANALPVTPNVLANTRKFKAKIVDETPKAYKFRTKKAYFWMAKKLVKHIDRIQGTVHIWDGANITWLRK